MDELNKQQEIIEEQKEEEKQVQQEVLEDIPSTEDNVETDDATGELQGTDEGSDKSEEVEDSAGEGGEAGEGVSEESESGESVQQAEQGEANKEPETVGEPPVEEQEQVDETEKEEEEVQQDGQEETPQVDDKEKELEELRVKVAEIEEERATETAITEFETLKANNDRELQDFNQRVFQDIKTLCAHYGVPMDMDFEEMRQVHPDKYNILQQILHQADEATAAKEAEIAEVEHNKALDMVFKKADKVMQKYNLSPEVAQEACNTFVAIMHDAGIKNLKDDLAAKVELAVARAKMIAGDVKDVKKDVEKVVEDVEKTVEDVKDAIVDVAKEAPKMEKSLDEFKEGASVGEKANAEPINESNVLQLWQAKEGDDRLAFFKQHQDLIQRAYLSDPKNGYLRDERGRIL